jgi:hypothetical protein
MDRFLSHSTPSSPSSGINSPRASRAVVAVLVDVLIRHDSRQRLVVCTKVAQLFFRVAQLFDLVILGLSFIFASDWKPPLGLHKRPVTLFHKNALSRFYTKSLPHAAL